MFLQAYTDMLIFLFMCTHAQSLKCPQRVEHKSKEGLSFGIKVQVIFKIDLFLKFIKKKSQVIMYRFFFNSIFLNLSSLYTWSMTAISCSLFFISSANCSLIIVSIFCTAASRATQRTQNNPRSN